MIKNIQAKTMLSAIKDKGENMFGLWYNMNLYRGCQHGCIYCDSRSTCYQIENFSDILIKENAISLLEKELRSKRTIGTIGTGSMNDPYMPIEKEVQLTRRALETISKFQFPVHILTKSDLVIRDLDIIEEISSAYAAVSLTITTAEDRMAALIEPGAPVSSRRFAAIEALAKRGIYTGIFLMPTLPYLTDSEENLKSIIRSAKDAGAQYIIAWMGMTIRDGQREYFYKELDKKFPGLKEKYIKQFGLSYECAVPEDKKRYELICQLCKEAAISTKMKVYSPKIPEQLSFFDTLK